MSLRPAGHTNYWAVFGHIIKLIRFYDQGQVVAETDFGYLPATDGPYCSTAAGVIAEISELHLARRNKPETGMAHGGHFAIRDTLYLDLSYFAYWMTGKRCVQTGAGYEIWAEGIELEYTVLAPNPVDGARSVSATVRKFVWNREKYEQRDTPEKAKLDALCELFNRTVADHSNRHLSASAAQRMLAYRADFIKLLESE